MATTVALLDGLQGSAQSLLIAVSPRYLFSIGFLHSRVSTKLHLQQSCAVRVIGDDDEMDWIPLALHALALEMSGEVGTPTSLKDASNSFSMDIYRKGLLTCDRKEQ